MQVPVEQAEFLIEGLTRLEEIEPHKKQHYRLNMDIRLIVKRLRGIIIEYNEHHRKNDEHSRRGGKTEPFFIYAVITQKNGKQKHRRIEHRVRHLKNKQGRKETAERDIYVKNDTIGFRLQDQRPPYRRYMVFYHKQ